MKLLCGAFTEIDDPEEPNYESKQVRNTGWSKKQEGKWKLMLKMGKRKGRSKNHGRENWDFIEEDER